MPDRNGYDLEMIRDFLEQLLCEVRVNHFDNTNKNPDTSEPIQTNLAWALKRFIGRTADVREGKENNPRNLNQLA
jgi:hypothetical protein